MLSSLITRLAAWRARRLKEAFAAAAQDPWWRQRELLADLIARDRSTEYGRRFGFSSIAGPEDFRRSVPLVEFEDVASDVGRMASGETDVLVSRRDPLLRFCLTSGTTGRPKTIPVTASFLRAYKMGWSAWVWALIEEFPLLYRELESHRLMALVSPPTSGKTPGGHPTGAITGLTTSSQARPLERVMAAPQACSSIGDFELRTYAVARFALEREVGHISTPNPSTLLRLGELMSGRTEELIRDLMQGTCRGLETLPADQAQALRRRLAPKPERARLMAKRAAGAGSLTPRAAWPNLKLLTCWTGGTLRLYLERLPGHFGDAAVRDMGLIASEGRMSLPLTGEASGALDLWSNVYEFIPEAEADSPSPKTIWLPEVEVGGRYFLVLTNRAGLYRYKIQDCVEVVGRYKETPTVVFLNKGRSISSMTGEKLTEHQVLSAAEKVFAPAGALPERFTVCPSWADPPRYVFCLERDGSCRDGEEAWRRRAEALDRSLKELNLEYDSKRSSGRLGALELRWLEPGSFARLEAERIEAAGGRAEQVKHPYLVADLGFLERLARPIGVE